MKTEIGVKFLGIDIKEVHFGDLLPKEFEGKKT